MALGMERERLGARELTLHRTLELIGSKRGQVLDGNVLLASKAAAHEHGLNDHTLGFAIPAKHVGALFARVVGTWSVDRTLTPFLYGKATAHSGSKKACSVKGVVKRCVTVNALSASALAASPRVTWRLWHTLSLSSTVLPKAKKLSCRRGASAALASTMLRTGSSGS